MNMPLPKKMRTIKKYPNRRLYDTEKSAFVTLSDVRRMVMEKTPFRVIDSKTSKDITRAILLQVISEQEDEDQESPMLETSFLEMMIRLYGSSAQQFMGGYLTHSLELFQEQQGNFFKQLSVMNPLQMNPFFNALADSNLHKLRKLNASLSSSGKEQRPTQSKTPPEAAPDPHELEGELLGLDEEEFEEDDA
ncbi:MAG: polyhydroxyalkanoate synthesis repressor PhaR [Magnetococcales bacterium]|nr:polyhydroxyalkanoate synthesis repressor PhaR [Magnetococcales bacterium]